MLLLLPILIPFASGALSLLLRQFRGAQRWIGVAGTTGLLWASVMLLDAVQAHGVVSVQLGGWPAPYGITLVADIFSALMILVTGLVGVASAVYSLVTIDPGRSRYGHYTLVHILLMGVCGAFLTGDLFNLYVWYEVMLIASFVLLTLGGTRPQIESAIKYVTMNLFASALFLAGVGLLYGLAGTLNMADLAVKLQYSSHYGLVTAVGMLFLVAFGIKSALFPVFSWLPASYHTPPVAVSALFAGLLTKVGVYSLIRVFTLIFVHDDGTTHSIILVVAGLTMITGVLGAYAQNEFRRILSFHIISQIGYMVMGLGLLSPLALSASVFYIIHHIIVKTNLFLVSGVVSRMRGSGDLARTGGMLKISPLVSLLFLIPALSLAGMPPLSGFFSKLFLVQAGLALEQWLVVGVALTVGLLTLMSMMKIWLQVFWKEEAPGSPDTRHLTLAENVCMLAPVAGLAIITLAIGFGAGPFLSLCQEAGLQLSEPDLYIQTVLGAVP